MTRQSNNWFGRHLLLVDPIKEFREDHRKARDGLLEMIRAIRAKNIAKASETIEYLDTILGPHFRYEEEILYHRLRIFLGEYIDELISNHDVITETAKNAIELFKKETISANEAEQVIKAAQKLLVYISNCDGLAIFTESLSPKGLEELAEKYTAVKEANIPMLEWAEKIRKRPEQKESDEAHLNPR